MRRILISLGITVLGLIISWFFLRPKELSDSVSTKQSVAIVVNLSNDVSRQSEGRLLWSPIRKGDSIFAGDKIKTSGLSSTTIQFADSRSKLDIEENSIVVIAVDKNKFSLNMLEGRVFVQGDKGKNSLNLLSAGKKIDYSGDTAVSVSESGESRVESFGAASLFQDLKPNYSQTLLSAKNEIELSWKKDNRNSPVDVYVGESPLLMKKVNVSSATFDAGKIPAMMKPGVNYWQLATTESGQEVRSPLMKVLLNRPVPSTQVFPLNKEVVTGNDRPFDFKWNKGSATGSTTLEVSGDPDFKKVVLKTDVTDQTFLTPDKILTEGDYFWRLSYSLPSGETIQSPVTSFTVHRGDSLISPAPLVPSDNARFYLSADGTTEVKFEWKRQENVTYTLKITGENFSREMESENNASSLSMNKTGTYNWEVHSRNAAGKTSVLPSKRKFEVKNLGKIAWMTEQKMYTYLENLPVIVLRWQKNYSGNSVLRIGQSPDLSKAENFSVNGRDFPFRPSSDGVFYAKVQGLDETGSTAAISDIFEFEVKIAPIPPAPILTNSPKKIIANSGGDFVITTTNQKRSWLFIAQLVDTRGGILDERRFSESTARFNGLLPGKYIVRTNFQDEFNRKGEVSVLELEVPAKAAIPAPKLKGIKVR